MSDACGMNEACPSRSLGLSISPYLKKNNLFLFKKSSNMSDMKTKMISIRIDDEDLEILKDFCDLHKFTFTEYFRILMKIHLGTEGFANYGKYLNDNKLIQKYKKKR